MSTSHLTNIKKRADRPCVLYLDDEASNRQVFRAAFGRDFEVLVAADLHEAWQILMEGRVHVMLADQRLRGASGSEILQTVRDRFPMVRRMLVTGYSDLQAVIDAINLGGVIRYITKPWDAKQLVKAVAIAFKEYCDEEDSKYEVMRLVEANQQLEFALRQRLLS